MSSPIKGKFTFRTAGVLFILSALFELFAINTGVPLLGALRTGAAAVGYHLIYVLLFSLLGYGLLRARSWAYRLLFVTTTFYSLDRMVFLLDRHLMQAYLNQQLAAYGDIASLVDMGLLLDVITVAALTAILCWWGFAWYAARRRAYFTDAGDKNT